MDAGRRALLLGSLAALLGPRAALAQTAERVARVGILGPTTAKHFAAGISASREGLRERGWLEGQNLVIEARFARERYDRLPALAAELVTLKVDAIFALDEHRAFIEVGGLASYGPDQTERFRQAADYVDRILKGARPGDLPIQQPSTFELMLNLRAAERLGLAIPTTVRLRATHVID